MSYPKTIDIPLTLNEQTYEALLICRFLDGMQVEEVVEIALKNYLDARRESTDFKAIQSVKKHHTEQTAAKKTRTEDEVLREAVSDGIKRVRGDYREEK